MCARQTSLTFTAAASTLIGKGTPIVIEDKKKRAWQITERNSTSATGFFTPMVHYPTQSMLRALRFFFDEYTNIIDRPARPDVMFVSSAFFLENPPAPPRCSTRGRVIRPHPAFRLFATAKHESGSGKHHRPISRHAAQADDMEDFN